jgi:hypothetical protein
MFRKCIPVWPARVLVIFLSFLLFVGLIIFPFFVNPVKEPLNRGFGKIPLEEMGINLNDSLRLELKKPKKLEGSGQEEFEFEVRLKKKHQAALIDINGKMTLHEINQKYQLDESFLLDQLGLPSDVNTSEHLGRLRKRYDFTIEEVREIVERELNKRKEFLQDQEE